MKTIHLRIDIQIFPDGRKEIFILEPDPGKPQAHVVILRAPENGVPPPGGGEHRWYEIVIHILRSSESISATSFCEYWGSRYWLISMSSVTAAGGCGEPFRIRA